MILFNKLFRKPSKVGQIIGCIVSIGFFVLLYGFLYSEYSSSKEENEKYYNWSYEVACEKGDFEAAHKILTKLKDDVLDEKKWESNHQIKKEKKIHWFTDDEIVVDSLSLEDHNQYMEGLQNLGRIYLAGLDYVYNAEIAYLKEVNEDENSGRIKHLLSELRSQLLLFKSLDMEDEAQGVYENVADKANERSLDQIMKETDRIFNKTDE